MSEFRFYCFTHFMLSAIQHGIQTGHASVDLVVKYASGSFPNPALASSVSDWARYDKTYVVLNGGNSAGLALVEDLLRAAQDRYPWVSFHEDHDSLCGLKTAVGVLLPKQIWDVRGSTDHEGRFSYVHTTADGQEVGYYEGHEDFALIKMVKTARLAG